MDGTDWSHDDMTTGEKLANSVWGIVLARYVTPSLVGVIVVLGGFIASGLFTRIDKLADAQETLLAQLNTQAQRITAMEARSEMLSVSRDNDVDRLIVEVGNMRGKLELTSAAVAALAAKMDILLRQNQVEVQ